MGGFLDGNLKYVNFWLIIMGISMGILVPWIAVELAIKRYKGTRPTS
jgi:hypothetical protein